MARQPAQTPVAVRAGAAARTSDRGNGAVGNFVSARETDA